MCFEESMSLKEKYVFRGKVCVLKKVCHSRKSMCFEESMCLEEKYVFRGKVCFSRENLKKLTKK